MALLLSKPESSRLRLRLLAATALGLAAGMDAQLHANPFGMAPVSDQQLSGMRGGFELPNGMNVAVAVEIETRVDGAVALRTVLNVVDDANAALEVFTASGPKAVLPAQAVAAALANPAAASPPATLPEPAASSPQAAAVEVHPVEASPPVPPAADLSPPVPAPAAAETSPAIIAPAVSLSVDAPEPAAVSPSVSAPVVSLGTTPETAGSDAPVSVLPLPAQSDLGTVTIEPVKAGSVVILKGPDLEIQHVTGNATGILIANTLDNRVIDTIATIHVALSDSAIPTGNMLLRMEAVVLDAVGGIMY